MIDKLFKLAINQNKELSEKKRSEIIRFEKKTKIF